MRNIRPLIRRWIPHGSPLSYPYERAKIWYLYASGRLDASDVYRGYVVHNNILLEKRKAIYFYIPKVACSSLKFTCAQILNMEAGAGDVVEEIHKIDFPFVKKYQVLSRYRDYFRFAFVRNPWDRLVSCYKDKINFGPGHVYNHYKNPFLKYLDEQGLFKQDMSFEDFVKVVSQIPDEDAEGHIRSQHKYLEDERGDNLVEFVGKFENLHRDMDYLINRLGVNLATPHLRKTPHKPYWEYYNNNTIQLVQERYKEDIRRFKYCFKERESESVYAAGCGC
jgi:Sulfotransferase family